MSDPDDPLIIDKRVKLSSKDDAIVKYLAKEFNISINQIFRDSLHAWFPVALERLSVADALKSRAQMGSNSGKAERAHAKAKKIRQLVDEMVDDAMDAGADKDI